MKIVITKHFNSRLSNSIITPGQTVPEEGAQFDDHNGLGREVRSRESRDILRPVLHTSRPARVRASPRLLPVPLVRVPPRVRSEERAKILQIVLARLPGRLPPRDQVQDRVGVGRRPIQDRRPTGRHLRSDESHVAGGLPDRELRGPRGGDGRGIAEGEGRAGGRGEAREEEPGGPRGGGGVYHRADVVQGG